MYNSEFYKYRKNEIGTIKKPFGLKLNIALVFPDTYPTAISNLGYMYLYRFFNSHADINCERFFLDSPNFSFENKRRLDEFDIIAFSIPYEPLYWNALEILLKNNIPVFKEKRKKHPLIFIGGIATWINPYPFLNIADFIIRGEIENLGSEFLDFLFYFQKENFIEELKQKFKNIYTCREDSTEIEFIKDLSEYEPIYSPIVSSYSQFKNKFLIEITRGCPYNCKFCYVGNFIKNFRQHKWEKVQKIFDEYECRNIGIISSSPTSWKGIEKLIKWAKKKQAKLSFSSFRVEGITNELLEILLFSGQKSITIAPETGDEKFRFFLNKKIPNEAFYEKIEKIFRIGFRKIKLYFIIGLPYETEEILHNNVKFLNKINKISKKYCKTGKLRTIEASFSIFVPKPGTPFEKTPYLQKNILEKKINFLRKELASLNLVKTYFETIKDYYFQYLLSNYKNCMVKLYQQMNGKIKIRELINQIRRL